MTDVQEAIIPKFDDDEEDSAAPSRSSAPRATWTWPTRADPGQRRSRRGREGAPVLHVLGLRHDHQVAHGRPASSAPAATPPCTCRWATSASRRRSRRCRACSRWPPRCSRSRSPTSASPRCPSSSSTSSRAAGGSGRAA